MVVNSWYLTQVFNVERFKNLFQDMKKAFPYIMEKYGKADALVFSGMSGAALAFPLSLEFGIPLLLVRKGDHSHAWKSDFKLEGLCKIEKYYIIDDFVDTGKTIKRIFRNVSKHRPGSQCLGTILYSATLHEWEDRKMVGSPVFGLSTILQEMEAECP